MLRFAVELCKLQHEAGRTFVFEHPNSAASWEDESLKSLLSARGVMLTTMDMCRYGMTSTDKEGHSSSEEDYEDRDERTRDGRCSFCSMRGGHRHVQLVSRRSKLAALYPSGFCEAIVEDTSCIGGESSSAEDGMAVS